MSNKDKEDIMYRRWIIVIIVILILITWLHLWTFIFEMVIPGILMIWAVQWFFDWITGADLDKKKGHKTDDDQPSEEEKTMWDIYTTHEIMDHHDHDDWDDHH